MSGEHEWCGVLRALRDGTPATARAIGSAEARERMDEEANQSLVDRLFPPLDSADPSSTHENGRSD